MTSRTRLALLAVFAGTPFFIAFLATPIELANGASQFVSQGLALTSFRSTSDTDLAEQARVRREAGAEDNRTYARNEPPARRPQPGAPRANGPYVVHVPQF